MGRLFYDGGTRLIIDDRTLAHLQFVITDKLRRHEGFLFTWRNPVSEGGGRDAVWLHPRAELSFTYRHRSPVTLNRAWIDELALAANSPAGLIIVPEPGDGDPET
jgi:hypothetical protein